MKTTAITLTGIVKHFGATCALDNAELTVRPGTVHALLGENGAGKTTLMRIAFGMLAPDAGTITVNGPVRRFASPTDAIAYGIGMVHQHFMLVPAMTVAENIALGGHGSLDLDTIRQRIQSASRRAGLPIDPDVRVATLPIGAQQRVEILKALTREATLLILDEPTAVLTPAESRDLLQRMRIFVAQGGTVILITHKLRDAIEFSDDITVLRNGRTVLTGRANEVTETQLAESMIGDGAPRTRSTSGTPRTTRDVLVLDNVAVTDVRGVERLVGATLHIRSGEIVGIAAVEGNGEHELLRVLAGRLTPTHGAATLPSTVGFVPEDRHRDALILDFTLSENVALAGSGTRRGRLHWDRYRANTASLLSKYDVRATGPSALARSLSGGNQQKFVIARELEAAPEALVAENPTRGLDIHATAAVHQRLRDARDAGVAIVMHSTDLDEVLALADRILVVSNGHVREMPHDRERIGRAMVSPV